ncbi:sodium:calcium antiporter [Halobacterium noricense]|uniref:sodium:calcium antiporter n=1 Tax=Halobacterium noricense TaxID=223182 RepID=UPI001E2C6721|nr:sodium:calcium antiporter [Halobacterium noricense]UHH24366.1 sodium:calcium antiporter [Halobacterium noricense]
MPLGGLLPSTPLVDVLVVVAATALVWFGSGWLESSAEHLSTYYGLPAVVQGSIVVAVGSSFPELASVVFTALAGTFNMGVGAIVGSAIFNILVIPALAGIATEGHLETNRTIVYKEAQFYMIAVSALVVTLALAVIYVPVSDGPALAGRLTRPLAVLPLLLYGLYLFVQWQDVGDHDAPAVPEGIAVGREWARLAGGLVLILVAVEQLVGAVESLGHTFGIPEFLAGVTIVAAATSLPDTLVSVRSAKAGKGITSLGNVLGSNTFDLLVAIPVGVLIVGAVTVNFAVAVPMLGVLTLATVLLFAILRTDLSVTGVEAYTLLAAYAAFVAWVVSETVGLTNLIKGI